MLARLTPPFRKKRENVGGSGRYLTRTAEPAPRNSLVSVGSPTKGTSCPIAKGAVGTIIANEAFSVPVGPANANCDTADPLDCTAYVPVSVPVKPLLLLALT
jgi:hypothetical protein